MNEVRQDEIWDEFWRWTQDSKGVIVLHAVVHGHLVPMIAFIDPHVLRGFWQDTAQAYEKFIPKTIRDALDLLEAHKPPLEGGTGLGQAPPTPTD